MSTVIVFLVQVSVLAYALLAGVFLAFSDFIMRALATTSGSGGVEAMQVINREVFRWVFMTLFLGMAPVSLLMAGYGWFALEGTARALIMLGAATYLFGSFAVTIAGNVPMNEALAGMDPTSDAAGTYWRETYVPGWTFWNTTRALACLAAAAQFLGALHWIA